MLWVVSLVVFFFFLWCLKNLDIIVLYCLFIILLVILIWWLSFGFCNRFIIEFVEFVLVFLVLYMSCLIWLWINSFVYIEYGLRVIYKV